MIVQRKVGDHDLPVLNQSKQGVVDLILVLLLDRGGRDGAQLGGNGPVVGVPAFVVRFANAVRGPVRDGL